jgi:hypothetical protein
VIPVSKVARLAAGSKKRFPFRVFCIFWKTNIAQKNGWGSRRGVGVFFGTLKTLPRGQRLVVGRVYRGHRVTVSKSRAAAQSRRIWLLIAQFLPLNQ